MHNTNGSAATQAIGCEAKDATLHVAESIKNLFGMPIDGAPARLKNSIHEAIMTLVAQEHFEDLRPVVQDLGELYLLINALEGCEECYWGTDEPEPVSEE